MPVPGSKAKCGEDTKKFKRLTSVVVRMKTDNDFFAFCNVVTEVFNLGVNLTLVKEGPYNTNLVGIVVRRRDLYR